MNTYLEEVITVHKGWEPHNNTSLSLESPWYKDRIDEVGYENTLSFRSLYHRDDMTKKYAWAIPSVKAIRFLTTVGPIVELGAGAGYWAMLLREAGVDIVAYDAVPLDTVARIVPTGCGCRDKRHEDYRIGDPINGYHARVGQVGYDDWRERLHRNLHGPLARRVGNRWEPTGRHEPLTFEAFIHERPWSKVEVGNERAVSRHGDRTLLLCWPPYGSLMALAALRLHQYAGGTQVVYVCG